MPVCMQLTFADATAEQYDAVLEALDWPEQPAEGGLAHLAGVTDAGLHIVDVWESPEDFERFLESRLKRALDAVGVPAPSSVVQFEVHNAWRRASATA